jgi:hypothetical protein
MGARNGSKPGSKSKSVKARRVELNPEELRTLLAACTMYRYSVPSYLASNQSKLRLIKTVIRKLS